jgi:hypothetical protein
MTLVSLGELLHAAAQPMQIRNARFPDAGGTIREVTYKPFSDEGPNPDTPAGTTTNESTRNAHTDSMGRRMPDFILLACAGAAKVSSTGLARIGRLHPQCVD